MHVRKFAAAILGISAARIGVPNVTYAATAHPAVVIENPADYTP